MSEIVTSHNEDFAKVITHFVEEISTLRTGRANPALVENVLVDAYDQKQPLVNVASLSTPDNKTIIVDPWDKSVMKAIETAITAADLGFNPVVQGNVIRISLPALTEENRKQLVKVMHEKLEQARVGVRSVRDNVKSEILKAEKEKEVSEDSKYQMLDELDAKAGESNEKIKTIGADKEKEIMTL